MPSTVSVLKAALAAAAVWHQVAAIYIPPFGYLYWPEALTCVDNGNARIKPKELQWKKTDDDWGWLGNSCSGHDASPTAAAHDKRDWDYQQLQTTDDVYRISGHTVAGQTGGLDFEACWTALQFKNANNVWAYCKVVEGK